jgi:hypothetical protein
MQYEDQLMGLAQTHNDSGTGNTVIVSPTQTQLEDSGFFDSAPSRGNRLITNLPELQNQADVYIQPQPPVSQHTPQESVRNEAQKDFISAYEERLLKTTNFMEKQRVMNELQNEAMIRLGNAQKATARVVEQDMNLPAYRAKLQKMINEDKRNRELEGLDSPNTAKLRDAVLQMEAQARKTTEEILKNNPDVKTFQTAVKTTLDQHSRLADKMLADQEKLLAKKEAEAEAAQQVASFVPPEARQAIVNMNPAMKDDVAFAKFVVGGGGKDKNWKPILDGTLTSSDYVPAAINGNTAARGLAISEYAVRTGKDVLAGEQEMRIAESIAKSPTLALDAFVREGVMPKTQADKIKSSLTAADASTRKDIAASLQAKIPDLMQARTVARVKADPTLVGQTMQSEEWNKAIAATAQKKGAPPSSFDVAMTYINAKDLSNQERIKRQEEVAQAYAATIAKEGASGIFHPAFQKDQLANYASNAKKQMASKTVSDTLTARLGAVFGQAGAIASTYNLPNQGQFMRSLGGQVVNMGDEFFDAARKGNQ